MDQKQPNLNENQLEALLKLTSQRLGTTPEALKQAAQNGTLSNMLGQNESAAMQKVLNDPEAAKKLLLKGFAHISRMKGERKIRVTFAGKSAFEPVIGNIILECKTPVNILYADTKTINGNAEGEMILQLPDSVEIADKIVEYFQKKGLGVEEVDSYVG